MTATLPKLHPVHAHQLREFSAPTAPSFVAFRCQHAVAQRLAAKASELSVDKSTLIRYILVSWLEQEDGINAYTPL